MVKDRSLSAFQVLLIASIGALLAMPVIGPPIPSFQSPVGTPATSLPEVSPTLSSPAPMDTPTLSPAPPDTPTPSPAPKETPTRLPPPTPLPTVTPTLPGWAGLLSGLPSWWPLAGAVCAGALVLLLVTALLFFRRRPKPRKPTRPLPPVPPSPPWLEAMVAGRPRRWPLEKDSMTVGRAPENDLVIPPELAGWETVSRRHARIYRQGENWIVEDLGSTNGIYVNGRRTGRNLLRDGWRLGIGGVVFTFRVGKGGAA